MTPGQEIADYISKLKYFTKETLAKLIDDKIRELTEKRKEKQ